MKVIKKYKTISILTFLIIVIVTLGVLYKKIDFENKEDLKTTVKLTPTTPPDPFLYADKLNIPSSYMGYTFIKLSSESAVLGSKAVMYSNKLIDLEGDEWLVKKNEVSENEFTKFKEDFKTFAESQLFKLGWETKEYVGGKELMPVIKNSALSNTWGFVKVYKREYQVLLLRAEKDKSTCPCNVQFRVFLSGIGKLDSLR